MDEGDSRGKASLSLRELCNGEPGWGSSFTGDPGRSV